MHKAYIPYRATGYFSKLICDYLEEKPSLANFYNRFPSLDNFKGQIEEKRANYNQASRSVLVDALQLQYAGVQLSKQTSLNLDLLRTPESFTITTGHQLNLFTGPLYFLYKIIDTIKLTKELKERYPEQHFIPVYWMASEDHDFEEINYFNFQGKKVQWNQVKKGAVGRLPTEGLDHVFKVFSEALGNTDAANEIKRLFTTAYVQHKTLTAASRWLVNELFGDQGLVIIDGDDSRLKQLLIPYIQKDIFEHTPYKYVTETIRSLTALSDDYKIQVSPREINYFYLRDGVRERIVEKNGTYMVKDTDLKFSRQELEKELRQFPERFSPNVIARPLYQEVILPNLCYIGGGGELAYWLELKQYFNHLRVSFPMLLLRSSLLLVDEKQAKKVAKLGLTIPDLFLKQSSLINKKIREVSNIDIDFSEQKKHLEQQFEALYALAKQTDVTFLNAVKAQEVKQKNGLDVLEKRLLKAQKQKLKDHVVRLSELQNQLFPNYSLQERQLNFSEIYVRLGQNPIVELNKHIAPLANQFLVLRV